MATPDVDLAKVKLVVGTESLQAITDLTAADAATVVKVGQCTARMWHA